MPFCSRQPEAHPPSPTLPNKAVPNMPTLNQNINTLGHALGTVLREQMGERFYALEEQVRSLSKKVREGEPALETELNTILEGVSTPDAEGLVRAFLTYFQLVNLAEELGRVEGSSARQAVRKQSLEEALTVLKERGLSADAVEKLIGSVELGLTFTAHPTEMRRRTVRHHLEEIRTELEHIEDAGALEKITAYIESLWGTLELRHVRPTVQDEVKSGLFYLNVIAGVLPDLENEFRAAFARVFGREVRLELPLAFHSWMGGDRDGNPFVTPEVTAQTFALHAERAEQMLRANIREAYAALSQHRERVTPPGSLPTAEEPWRNVLQKLFDGPETPDLERDLALLETSLETAGQKRSGRMFLHPVTVRSRVLGRHLLTLDVREHSEKTGAAVAELLREAGIPDYLGLEEAQKVEVLRAELRSRRPLLPREAVLSQELQSVLGPLEAVREAMHRHGTRAFGRYIVSMSESVSDLLEPLILAREMGVRALPVPLFETLTDLQNAPRIMAETLELPEYRALLGADVQEIMLGYSDSNKDAGFLAANWALHEAQRQVSSVCRAAQVPWRFFHGRGTSIGRGGGPMARGILGQPKGTMGRGLRITEQGEAMADKYNHPLLAFRNLEQGIYALLLAASSTPEELPLEWITAMDTAAHASQQAYRKLVEHPDFIRFYEETTPIREISKLNIASRPVRRPGPSSLHSLRAIPWVMSWTQNRANVPGWFGLGVGLESIPLELAQAMYRDWPFFRSMLDNAQMSLSKSDFLVFRQYLTLDPQGSELGPLILERFEHCLTQVKAVVGGELLEGEPKLKRSIELRNPYIDPIHRLQVELLRRMRSHTGPEDRALERALLLSLQGVSAGMRNTG